MNKLVLFVIVPLAAFAASDKGEISGTVFMSSDNRPASQVVVNLKARLIDGSEPFWREFIFFPQMVFQALFDIQTATVHCRNIPLAKRLATPLAVYSAIRCIIYKAFFAHEQS